MSKSNLSLDDLHDEDESIIDTAVDPAKPENEGEDPNNDEGEDDGEGNSGGDEPGGNGEPEEEPASGLEQFLSQYGIVGGMIEFEEGEQKHFNELESEEQFNILFELAQRGKSIEEQNLGLDDDEVELVNWIRNTGRPVEEAVNILAQERLAQLEALRAAGGEDFTTMSEDAIMAKWLKENNPEANEIELAEELERQKESSFFSKNANKLRSQYVAQQEQEARIEQEKREMAAEAELEEDRARIVNAAMGIKDVIGYQVSDEIKNEVLESILEVNEHGDSLFMQEVFGDPEKLFKAAWLYKFAESHVNDLETYYKKELANKYQEGRRSVTGGLPSEPVHGSGSTTGGKKAAAETGQRTKPTKTLDDIHND